MRVTVLLSVLLALSFSRAVAEMPPHEPQDYPSPSLQKEFESKSHSINALLNAYRNIAGDTQAGRLENHLRQLVDQAHQLLLDGDYSRAKALLDQAYNRIKKAVISGRDGDTLVKKRGTGEQYQIRPGSPAASRYQARSDSIDALYAAYIRVTNEKGLPRHGETMAHKLRKLKSRADALQTRGEQAKARGVMEDAYTLVKAGLSSLRDGETLVRSLNFSGPEQEYAYYVEKTHSQKTAIEIMLQLNDSPGRHRLLTTLLEGAEAQLVIADRNAAQGNYARALPIMDRVFTRLQSGLMMSLSSR